MADEEIKRLLKKTKETPSKQERGDVAKRSDGLATRDHVPDRNKIATTAESGLSRKKEPNRRTTH